PHCGVIRLRSKILSMANGSTRCAWHDGRQEQTGSNDRGDTTMSSEHWNVAAQETTKLRCFVVMGFGVKTDLATGRKLDLDKSYKRIIKPVAEAKGLECIRADELRYPGSIDVPMYDQPLTADVVIADLSTANPNALYELGIRHALRPHTTI